MLGLAFSEAKRSEEFSLRRRRNAQQQQVFKAPPSSDADGSITTNAVVRKRTRRRRRQKKTSAPTEGAVASSPSSNSATSKSHVVSKKKQHDAPMTKKDLYFCLRCGVVIVGKQGTDSAVGRVTLVNWENQVVFDRFVKVPLTVTDYRTKITGISKQDLASADAIAFDQARKEVGKLIKGKILIGHGLEVDLSVLGLCHPSSDVRDTATYAPYMQNAADAYSPMLLPRDLSTLAKMALNRNTVGSPVSEAIACLDLYKAARSQWESSLIGQAQQKERQRQLVISMRAASREIPQNRLSVPLSAIREDEVMRRYAPFSSVKKAFHNSPCEATVYESSIASTDPTTAPSRLSFREDDSLSQTSTFVSQDNDLGSHYSNMPFFDPRQLLEIENMNEVLDQRLLEVSGSSTAYSSPNEKWYLPSFESTGCDHHGHANSLRMRDHPNEWHASPATTIRPTRDTQNLESRRLGPYSYAGGQQETAALLSEEELLQHLPSQLIADLDESFDTCNSEKNQSNGIFRSLSKEFEAQSEIDITNHLPLNLIGEIVDDRSEHYTYSRGAVKDMLPEKKTPGVWFRSLRM